MHQIRFWLGLRPRPRWGSLQRSPRPPSCIWGPTSKWRGGEGRGKERAMRPQYSEEVYAYGYESRRTEVIRLQPHVIFALAL